MRFLKPLKAKLEPNERSRAVEQMERRIQEWMDEPVEKQEILASHVTALRRALVGLELELREKGDATKLTVFGLPIKGGRDNAKREATWWIPDGEWERTSQVPLRLSVTGADVDEDEEFYDEDDVLFQLWIFDRVVYLALDESLTERDVAALANQDKNTRRLALEKAHALQAMAEQLDKPRQRERLPQDVRIEVWQRDNGRCVECGSQENLEFDHIIPFAMGGSNTARNLQLLCGDCNRRKGMTLG